MEGHLEEVTQNVETVNDRHLISCLVKRRDSESNIYNNVTHKTYSITDVLRNVYIPYVIHEFISVNGIERTFVLDG